MSRRTRAALGGGGRPHTFDPDELEADVPARRRHRGGSPVCEEFTAIGSGWPVHLLEVAVRKARWGVELGRVRHHCTWGVLAQLDGRVFRRVVPKKYFYNVSVTGVKPG